jgi:uncharacterized protein (TIGR03000 family)
LLLPAAYVPAAPPSVYSPGFVQPPAYTRYPPTRAFFVPYHPATASWFAPPEAPAASRGAAPAAQPSPPATTQAPAALLGPALPFVPRPLREPEPARAEIEVRVPPDAELWFGGAKTRLSGAVRLFKSPPLEPGQWYGYDVKARWVEGGQEVVRTTHVSVAAGARSAVDFTKPGDK